MCKHTSHLYISHTLNSSTKPRGNTHFIHILEDGSEV